jgi:prefoldin subunit 5
LRDQKRSLEEAVSTLRTDKGFLEDKAKDIHKKIAEMKRYAMCFKLVKIM